MSEYVTVSNEAMAILIFENSIDTWKDMDEKSITKKSEVIKNIQMVALLKGRLQVLVGIKDGLVMESNNLTKFLTWL